jgi:multisubunit Na+/H+ antiporter MnhG subunit
MKKVVPLLVVSVFLIAVAALFAPQKWMWPVIGAIAFVAIFVTTRVASMVITEAAEKKFNERK